MQVKDEFITVQLIKHADDVIEAHFMVKLKPQVYVCFFKNPWINGYCYEPHLLQAYEMMQRIMGKSGD